MKTKKYILFALAVLGLTTSCMKGDWDAPSPEDGMASYGNQDIKATNLKTIAEVKELYANEINNNSLAQITQPMQIQGIVTGNDVGGNIYNSLYIQDNTGAIVISIGQGGLYGQFAEGNSVLIELNGLYVGGYGKQPQIGTIYNDPKKAEPVPQVGRMTRYLWNDHYKLIDPIPGLEAKPLEVKFSLMPLNIEEYCGRLITLKGVELKDADGMAVFAPSDGSVSLTANCANRPIKGLSDVVLRTSTYADFAKYPLPTGRVDITGVASRYNDTWQFLMRDYNDIQPTTLSPDDIPPTFEPSGEGTATAPYNVAGIINATKDLTSGTTTSTEYYVAGYITKVSDFSDKYSSISYYISDDMEGLSESFYVYSGLGLNKKKFTSKDDLKVGDEVIVCGKITNFKGIIEFQSNNYLIKLNDQGDTPVIPSGDTNVTKSVEGTVVTLTNTSATASANTITVDLSQQGWENSKEPSTVTLSDGTTISFDKGEGSTTPKYYDGTKGVRVYAKNFIKIAGSSKAIAKVVLNCDSYNGTDYIGNGLLYGLADGLTMFIYNENTEASGGVQLRVKTIEITYAE